VQIDSHREARFGSQTAAPIKEPRGSWPFNNGQEGERLARPLRARSGIQLYLQPSEGRSSHYEATGDYLNSRCVYYKEEPKPATYGAP
jgi:hypothetical protein